MHCAALVLLCPSGGIKYFSLCSFMPENRNALSFVGIIGDSKKRQPSSSCVLLWFPYFLLTFQTEKIVMTIRVTFCSRHPDFPDFKVPSYLLKQAYCLRRIWQPETSWTIWVTTLTQECETVKSESIRSIRAECRNNNFSFSLTQDHPVSFHFCFSRYLLAWLLWSSIGYRGDSNLAITFLALKTRRGKRERASKLSLDFPTVNLLHFPRTKNSFLSLWSGHTDRPAVARGETRRPRSQQKYALNRLWWSL